MASAVMPPRALLAVLALTGFPLGVVAECRAQQESQRSFEDDERNHFLQVHLLPSQCCGTPRLLQSVMLVSSPPQL